mmetsp:Transcript_44063/g.79264  ORF Transcript_44063/g.79264 Transcript_44063/m.79264 type:complete len:224 (-) Transcript_44063:78-749(-)
MEGCRWLTASRRPSCTKQRNSPDSSRSYHRRRTKTNSSGLRRSMAPQSSKARQRSCTTKSEAFKRVNTSRALSHLSHPITHLASFGALQFSFGKAEPPNSLMASFICSCKSGKDGALAALELTEPPSPASESEPPSPHSLSSSSSLSSPVRPDSLLLVPGNWIPSAIRYCTKSSGKRMMRLLKVWSRNSSYHESNEQARISASSIKTVSRLAAAASPSAIPLC